VRDGRTSPSPGAGTVAARTSWRNVLTSSLTTVVCALAFQRLGFEVESYDERRLILVRDGRRVMLPRHQILKPPHLVVILKVAHVSERDFVDALPPEMSGTYPRDLVDAIPPASESEPPSSGRTSAVG